MKVLIFEDDARMARLLIRVLGEEGFTVDSCGSAQEGIPQATRVNYDLIVLDWMLPGEDGLSVCRRLRQAGRTVPILMLTARGEEAEIVAGLDSGADDYLTKPFEVEILLARVRALLRRAQGFRRLCAGDITIDTVHRIARCGERIIDLTSREYNLLVFLVRRCNEVVSRSEILAQVWETKFGPGSNLVDVHISRVRDKLDGHAWMLETVRGIGYRLRTTPETQ